VLNLTGENLFAGEQATAVDLPALTAMFGLHEITFENEPATGLRLFYAS
jgi:hypothetical protein